MKSLQAMENFVDLRNSLPRRGTYIKRNQALRTRVWHNSLTLSHLSGSDAASFARFHTSTNGWPGIAYHLVIEPKNPIQTPRGLRARVVWANDFDRRSYHAGNANDYAIGICVAGDYRHEDLKDYVKATIDEVQAALVADGYGREDKSHHEMPGYSWKACCVFDYKAAFKFLDSKAPVTPAPGVYEIQEGDTLWNIANNLDGISVADLLEANPGIEPSNLQIGQKIKLGEAKGAEEKVQAAKPAPAPNEPEAFKLGSRVVLKTSARQYATGESIPTSVKGNEYTVMQIGTGRVLLKEILSWVLVTDLALRNTVTQVAAPAPSVALKVGGKVTLSKSATHYATGQRIPDSVKGRTYTILQLGNGRVLLREIMSWVKSSDVGGASKAAKPAPKVAKVGSRVTLKKSASRYATGENIPASVKGRTYTVQQVRNGQVLLKEILSWVYTKDITVK